MTLPPPVSSELQSLVNAVRGQNTIIYQQDLLEAAISGEYPAVKNYLSTYKYSKQAMSNALRSLGGIEPYSFYRNNSVRTWRVL